MKKRGERERRESLIQSIYDRLCPFGHHDRLDHVNDIQTFSLNCVHNVKKLFCTRLLSTPVSHTSSIHFVHPLVVHHSMDRSSFWNGLFVPEKKRERFELFLFRFFCSFCKAKKTYIFNLN